MQDGHEPKSVWPMMAPFMAWSPQVWLGALFGCSEDKATNGVSAQPKPAEAVEAAMHSAMQGSHGLIKAGTQTGAEVMALASRRSQALVALAGEVGKCRAPQDLIALQMQFWQTAFQQSTEASRRIAVAWSSVLPIAGALADAGQAQTASAGISPPRDRITFTEPKDAGIAAPSPTRTQGDRRTAA